MDKIEKKIQNYAVYSPGLYKLAPVTEILKGKKLKKIGEGMLGRVFRIVDENWVIKEGRWDLDFDLFGNTKLPLPAELTERIMGIFSFRFLPRPKEIARQYKQYLTFAQYFGYFTSKDSYHHPNLDLLVRAQKNIRESLLFYKKDIEDFYKIKLNHKLDSILASEIKYHNFLPKEYLLVGKSISKANQGKETYFIFQEYVEGKLLHDIEDENLSDSTFYQLILIMYLTLLLNLREGLLPDTRPRYPLYQLYNWVTNTDNIIVSSKDQLKFIDTRFFWETQSNFIRKGGVISDLIINLTKNYLNYLLEYVD